MKIKWLGHASFALTTQKREVIITDPYEAGGYNGALRYPQINITADIVTVSHQHADHNDVKSLPGKPKVIDKIGEYDVGNIKIKGIPSFHDASNGKERGKNIIFIYEMDGLRVAHLGDLGHIPSKEQLDKMGKIDVLFVPVGGYFTIDANTATEVVDKIRAKVNIPMHYKTDVLNFPVATVESFTEGKENVKKFTSSETIINKDTLPRQGGEIWVMPYTR